jgi:hypothetical protein
MKKILLTIFLMLCFMQVLQNRATESNEHASQIRPTIALVNRVVEVVERRTNGVEWTKAKIGDLLISGDVVKTGPQSFSLIRFYDNSLLRIQEFSEVTIYSDRDKNHYHRNIEVGKGSIGFDVRKEERDRFEFSTATSVASIRGSSGLFSTVSDGGDVLLMTSGSAVLKNTHTGKEVAVRGGEIAFSRADGSLDKRDISQHDIQQYGASLGETGIHRDRRQPRTIEIRVMDEHGNVYTRTYTIIGDK